MFVLPSASTKKVVKFFRPLMKQNYALCKEAFRSYLSHAKRNRLAHLGAATTAVKGPHTNHTVLSAKEDPNSFKSKQV